MMEDRTLGELRTEANLAITALLTIQREGLNCDPTAIDGVLDDLTHDPRLCVFVLGGLVAIAGGWAELVCQGVFAGNWEATMANMREETT
jgi:hypothetical protein